MISTILHSIFRANMPLTQSRDAATDLYVPAGTKLTLSTRGYHGDSELPITAYANGRWKEERRLHFSIHAWFYGRTTRPPLKVTFRSFTNLKNWHCMIHCRTGLPACPSHFARSEQRHNHDHSLYKSLDFSSVHLAMFNLYSFVFVNQQLQHLMTCGYVLNSSYAHLQCRRLVRICACTCIFQHIFRGV